MTDLPIPFSRAREEYPEAATAYDALGDADPLDDRTHQLVRLALAIVAHLEGASVHYARCTFEIGISAED